MTTKTNDPFKVLRIDAPHFVAGLVIQTNGTVGAPAPIVKYMKGWSEEEVLAFCKKKGWSVIAV